MTATEEVGSRGVPENFTAVVTLTWIFRVVFAAVMIAGIILVIRMGLVPLAHEIKGTNTTFNFSFGITISLILNLGLAAGLLASEVDRRGANRELRNTRGTPKR
jgi:hypothetical protein